MDNLTNNNWNDAHRYILSRKNAEKRRYAQAWYEHCRWNKPINSDDFNLSYMARQGVRLCLAEYGVEEN